MDLLKIGNREFSSRLFVGTGKFSSNDLMLQAILASESEMITVAMKRLDTSDAANDDMLKHIVAAVSEFDAFHGHGDHLGARGLDGLLHKLV